MEKREVALREALTRNEEETARWKSYKEENITAIENLDKFRNYLTVDVMVPIGQKAYMPGQLVHTNEVLVGHYQGYFSKCSAQKAKEICEYRVNMATEHLEKLNTESDLWQNKLQKPYAEGVFPSTDACEIIEEYNEEKEKIWRDKHKLLVKEAKAREKEDRGKKDANGAGSGKNSDLLENEIFKMLEEAELMEELENELESLEINDISDETIKKLMAGDMKLAPEKQRVAYAPNMDQSKMKSSRIVNKSTHDVGIELQGIVKKTDLEPILMHTNNNHHPNPELSQSNNTYRNESEVDIEELPREVQIINEQAKFLQVADQIGFYEFQIKIMRQKLLTLPLKTQDDIDQKVHILNVIEALEESLEITEDSAEAQEEEIIRSDREGVSEEVSDVEAKTKESDYHKKEKQKKRRISFALQNETLEFRRNETVSEMLPKTQPRERDVVLLDEPVPNLCTNVAASWVNVDDRKQNIIDRVEQNLKFIEETQSTQDFQLVDKILENSLGGCYTLRINFQHSLMPGMEASKNNDCSESEAVPGSPSDLYQAYRKNIGNPVAHKSKSNADQIIFTNAYNGEDKVKVPLLKEIDRSKAYVDQRKEFCKPMAETKSILRNKSAVEKEHNLDRKKEPKKKKAAAFDEGEYMSAYYKVMNEVFEKPLTEPEPLPDCKYIDAHAPKKRVSRFKKSRVITETA
ncbi:PREDICTED: unconventional prefoldin RPB5 interactor-like protein [Rhagoletis zephyria]|uniref:unconventional prefoldin RPB5 interactor-like protein n=1 Tax=Rhagoletis zephyria TaxID=28612 RepID=UPI0008115A8C|nr:PREDICTED: unconventional prefoldin RPB5 interactor-like protein [Rhagoletis zephyria]